jgi:uncharacterized protein YbjT (DUF2867 family)
MTAIGARKILVTGATGKQGGAAVPHLISYGHHVRVMTRNPEKAKGKWKSGVQVVPGDFRDIDSLKKAVDGMDAVYLMGTPYEEGAEAEADQGKRMIDACAAKGVRHVVYSSVCCAEKKTGIPHFDSKYAVEEHLKESGISYTIFRPVFFMQNLLSDGYRSSMEKGVLSTPLAHDRVLQMISIEDIGRIVAEAVTIPSKFIEREIDLAGDEMSMEDVAGELSRTLARPVRYEQIPDADADKAVGHDLAVMYRWINRHGFHVNLRSCQELFQGFQIPMTSLREYLESTRGESRLAA